MGAEESSPIVRKAIWITSALIAAGLWYGLVCNDKDDDKEVDEPTINLEQIAEQTPAPQLVSNSPINNVNYNPKEPVDSYHDLPEDDPVREYLETIACAAVNRFDAGYEKIISTFVEYEDDYMSSFVIREVASAWKDMLALTADHGTDINLEVCGHYEDRMWESIDNVYAWVDKLMEKGNDDGYMALLLAEAHYDDDAMADAKDYIKWCSEKGTKECATYQDAFVKEFGESFAEHRVKETYEDDGLAAAHDVAEEVGMGFVIGPYYAENEMFFDAADASCPATEKFSLIGEVSLFYEDISVPFESHWLDQGCQFSLSCLSSRLYTSSDVEAPFWYDINLF